MRALTDQEQRTIRIGVVILSLYLALFYGVQGWRHLETRRAEYERLVQRAQQARQELRSYEKKALVLERLKHTYQLDPRRLPKATLVAEASAAIQKAATAGGVQVGPIRESPARASAKELASMQLEGIGPAPAVMGLLARLERLGFPLILDSLQITADAAKPGVVKVNLTIVILDFDQWKAQEPRHV